MSSPPPYEAEDGQTPQQPVPVINLRVPQPGGQVPMMTAGGPSICKMFRLLSP